MKYAYIEITEKCNLNCPFCPSAKWSGHRGEMPLALFEKILARLQGNVQEIFLHVLGEPLLHPQFTEILNAVDASDLRLNLTTNGLLIAKFADRILESKALRQINFSTHAYAYLPQEKELEVLNDTFIFADRLQAERPETQPFSRQFPSILRRSFPSQPSRCGTRAFRSQGGFICTETPVLHGQMVLSKKKKSEHAMALLTNAPFFLTGQLSPAV